MILEALIVLFLVFLAYKWRRPANFPPGPFHLPIIGALLYVLGFPDEVLSRLEKLRKKYGNICGLRILFAPIITISGAEDVKDAIHNEMFINRPGIFYSWLIKLRRYHQSLLGISMADGEFWREQRRFTQRHLKDFGFGKTSLENIIHQEVEAVLQEIQKSAGPNCRNPVALEDLMKVANLNVLWHIMSGEKYDHNFTPLRKLLPLLEIWNKSFTNMTVSEYILNFLKSVSTEAEHQTVKKTLQDFVMETIQQHESTLDPNNPRDFIDIYLMEINKRKDEPNSSFTVHQLRGICFDLFLAGVHTTSGTLRFALLYMMLNPKIQERIQSDLDKVVGKDRLPSLADRQSLPYIEATINETLRIRPAVPVPLRCCAKWSTFKGYTVPKNTIIASNIMSCHMDHKVWEDPDVFRPERFLDENGELKKHDVFFIPFGAGKRSCIGESLARNNLFLFFSAIMQKYRLQIPHGDPPPSTKPVGGVSVSPEPFKIKLEARW